MFRSSINAHYVPLVWLFIILLLSCKLTIGQAELSFVSQTDYVSLHNTGLNDVWGYVDEQGNEYAIVGTEDGTSIMNVSDPANPFEVFWLPGENSIWRDPSVYGDYAYISTEAEEGLTIINMSPLPESNVFVVNLFTGDESLSWESAHNCHVDDQGLLYVFGANLRHSHVKLSYPKILEYLFISPYQHQIHHSIRKEHHNKNLGSKLAVWDWLFGTLILSGSKKSLRFGIIDTKQKYTSFIYNLIAPFKRVFRK